MGFYLKLVADADEAEFSRLLLHVFVVVGVLEETSDEGVLGLAEQRLQRHVQGVVVLLHEFGLKISRWGFIKSEVSLRRSLTTSGRTVS